MSDEFSEPEIDPADELEPLSPVQRADESDDHFNARVNEYREASIAFLRFYDSSLAFVMSYENPVLAAWVVAMATGRTAITGGIEQKELAERLGVTKAAVNKAVSQVRARFGPTIQGLTDMPGQRTQKGRQHMAQARFKQLMGDKSQ